MVTNTADSLAWAELMLRMRREREKIFGKHLFADPCWDMLLDLYVALRKGRVVSVSSLCVAAAVPASTALRWIEILVKQDLVLREPDPKDKRRILVVLTRKAETQLDHFFAKLFQGSPISSGDARCVSSSAENGSKGGKHEAQLALRANECAALQALSPTLCHLLESARAGLAEALRLTAHGNVQDSLGTKSGTGRHGYFQA